MVLLRLLFSFRGLFLLIQLTDYYTMGLITNEFIQSPAIIKVNNYQIQQVKLKRMYSFKSFKIQVNQAIDFLQSNRNVFLGVGLTLIGAYVGSKVFMSKGLSPDVKKVLQLRALIEKSYPNALQSLQTLNIQKRILTEYGSESADDNELDMMFLVITRLKLKEKNKQKELRNPFLPPFEDGLFISELQPSHRLLYNKYNIFKNHLLVVTKEFEAQSNELTVGDFRQSVLVLKALQGLLFFNSGPDSGSSQPHKHVQIFPKQALELPIVKKVTEYVKLKSKTYNYQTQPIIQFPGFNFIHGLILLKAQQSISASKTQMYNAYKRIMQQKIYSINANAYNIVGNEDFILVVARSKEKAFDEIAINSVGFMGSLLFKDEEKLNKYVSLKIKPSSILEDITYPKGYVPKRLEEMVEKSDKEVEGPEQKQQ